MVLFIVALLMLLSSFILNSSLLAYGTYVLLGILLFGRFAARNWLGRLEVRREISRTMAEIGDKVSVSLTLRNAGAVPAIWLLAEDMLPRFALSVPHPRLRVKGKRIVMATVLPGREIAWRFSLECLERGCFQIGPTVLESGDVFGLHRRFRVAEPPQALLVLPRIVPLQGYELASRRPIGEAIVVHRLYEDPTRIAGVRPYEAGDPMSRVHWRATARTGQLHSKVYEATTLAGATIVLDFHDASYPNSGEPYRSELAVLAAASLANAVDEIGQQVGLATNAADAAERFRLEGWDMDLYSRRAARTAAQMEDDRDSPEPMIVQTRRGPDQLQRIRETLARAERSEAMTFPELILRLAGRLPRDATVVAILGDVSMETALVLGNLRRQGFAISVILVALTVHEAAKAHGRLLAEGVKDVRSLMSEEALPSICLQQVMGRGHFATEAEYEANLADKPEWMRQTPYEVESPEA